MNTLFPKWAEEPLTILALLAVITLVIRRLPRIDLGHSDAFRRRRFQNWFPVGMTYAFLYMARYNLNGFKIAMGEGLTKENLAHISACGTMTYGFAFLLNGPLTDRWGGRTTILISAVGTLLVNAAMGGVLALGWTQNLVTTFAVLYSLNMYFQSFGAVAIVKVNAPWFHVRERGTFGGIFGILISLGLYFAFDWVDIVARNMALPWVFFIPALLLVVFATWVWAVVRNTPGEAGFADFDTADASSGDHGPPLGVFEVASRMFRNPVIIFIAAIEFCSGYLRNAIMQWYKIFAKETGVGSPFISAHWGMLLCVAGILGGVVAGAISDHVFGSRRGPVAAILYGAMVAGSAAAVLLLGSSALGWLMIFMSLCIIGVHGMLSGTASMDFGGKKNAGVVVGIIDGFVYLGTATQFFVLGKALPSGAQQKVVAAWMAWPLVMLPVSILGFLLATRVWNATPHKASVPNPTADGEPLPSASAATG